MDPWSVGTWVTSPHRPDRAPARDGGDIDLPPARPDGGGRHRAARPCAWRWRCPSRRRPAARGCGGARRRAERAEPGFSWRGAISTRARPTRQGVVVGRSHRAQFLGGTRGHGIDVAAISRLRRSPAMSSRRSPTTDAFACSCSLSPHPSLAPERAGGLLDRVPTS